LLIVSTTVPTPPSSPRLKGYPSVKKRETDSRSLFWDTLGLGPDWARVDPGGSADETWPKRLIHYPMGRFGTLEELAGTVAYLASDDSGFVTGASVPINGGITTAFTVPS
jgi:NAD(P)-dependent dehydrogenase (short-subunit alcohol dehydrogenase family)